MEIKQISTTDLRKDEHLLNQIIDAKLWYYGCEVTDENIWEISSDIFQDLQEWSEYFWCFVDNVLAGYTQWYQNWVWYQSTWVYVQDSFRWKWIAFELKKTQINFAQNIADCIGVRWWIVSHNTASIGLFEKLGFSFQDRWDSKLALLLFRDLEETSKKVA